MLLQKLNKMKGFTLIELMIVIAILGIIFAIAIPNFIAYKERNKEKQITIEEKLKKEIDKRTPSTSKEGGSKKL